VRSAVLTVNPQIDVPHTEFEFSFARSSGPGGQNVNKVNSKAMLRWPVRANLSLPAEVRQRFLARFGSRLTVDGDLLITSQRYRDQGRNVADCLEKLREMLLVVARGRSSGVRRSRRKPRRPGGWKQAGVSRKKAARRIVSDD